MMTMMRYEWLTLPLGVGGLGGAYALYFRERRRCDTAGCRLVGEGATRLMLSLGCRLVGEGATRLMLSLATVVVAVALLLKVFPAWTADILQRL